MPIECYKIDWSKPFSFTEAVNQPEARQLGIYAIYKTVSAKKILCYIGKSQEIGRILSEHKQGISHMFSEKDIKKHCVCFGTIYWLRGSISTVDISPQQLREVESFFINELRPDGNGESTKKRYIGESVIIINTGKLISLDKVMAHNKELLKLLKDNLVTKKPKSSSSSFGF